MNRYGALVWRLSNFSSFSNFYKTDFFWHTLEFGVDDLLLICRCSSLSHVLIAKLNSLVQRQFSRLIF